MRIASRLEGEGVRHFVFSEPDIENQPTALVTAPVYGEQRRAFRRYKCLTEND